MTHHLLHSPLPLLLFLALIFTSCNAQNLADSQTKEQSTSRSEYTEKMAAQLGNYILEIFEDSKGNLWFCTLEKGVAKYDGKSLTYFTTIDGLAGNYVTSIVEDAEGFFWFGTHSGISKWDGKTFVNYTEKEGLCSNDVSHLLLDSAGNFWVGTWNGVCKLQGASFAKFPIPTPDFEILPYQDTTGWLTEITEDAEGNIWFGRGGYGACKYDGTTFTHFSKKDGLASNAVSDIQEDANGHIWISSRVAEEDHPDVEKRQGPGGVVKYDGERWINFPDVDGLFNTDVFELYRDTKDNIWIGTLKDGIYKYDGVEFTNYAESSGDGVFPKAVTSVLEDRKGTIWIGCAGGLFRLTENGVVNVTTNGPWK
ncbi:MAG: ligand-binding sensor domain-containing protein [Flavobacteriales bacterium]|jgi:ligand-binding sensor domain-containing protein